MHVLAAQSSTTYSVPELRMSITLPDGWVGATRNVQDNQAFLEYFGLEKSDETLVVQKLIMDDVYFKAFNTQNTEAFFIQTASNVFNQLPIYDYRNCPDSLLDEILSQYNILKVMGSKLEWKKLGNMNYILATEDDLGSGQYITMANNTMILIDPVSTDFISDKWDLDIPKFDKIVSSITIDETTPKPVITHGLEAKGPANGTICRIPDINMSTIPPAGWDVYIKESIQEIASEPVTTPNPEIEQKLKQNDVVVNTFYLETVNPLTNGQIVIYTHQDEESQSLDNLSAQTKDRIDVLVNHLVENAAPDEEIILHTFGKYNYIHHTFGGENPYEVRYSTIFNGINIDIELLNPDGSVLADSDITLLEQMVNDIILDQSIALAISSNQPSADATVQPTPTPYVMDSLTAEDQHNPSIFLVEKLISSHKLLILFGIGAICIIVFIMLRFQKKKRN